MDGYAEGWMNRWIDKNLHAAALKMQVLQGMCLRILNDLKMMHHLELTDT